MQTQLFTFCVYLHLFFYTSEIDLSIWISYFRTVFRLCVCVCEGRGVMPICLTDRRDMDTWRTRSSKLERIHEKTSWALVVEGRVRRRLITQLMKLWVAIWRRKKRKHLLCEWVDGRLVFLCAFLKSHEWLDELFSQKCCSSGASSISPFSLVGYFSPPLDPGHPVQLQLQRSLLCLQPSSLFVSFLQLCFFFLNPLNFFTLLFCPFLVLQLTPAPLCLLLRVCWALTALSSHPRPSNPDSSALFLLLWWMLVCFSFAGRILSLWGQGECFSLPQVCWDEEVIFVPASIMWERSFSFHPNHCNHFQITTLATQKKDAKTFRDCWRSKEANVNSSKGCDVYSNVFF